MIIYEIVIEEKVRERKENYKIGVDINKKDWTKTRITLRNDENDGRKKKIPRSVVTYEIIARRESERKKW